MLQKLKELFGITRHTYTAQDYYSITRYGTSLTEDQIKARVIERVDDQIKSKIQAGQYTLVLDMMGDVERYKDLIIDTFQNERGCIAQVISVVLNNPSKSEVEYILITWDKMRNRQSSDMVEYESEPEIPGCISIIKEVADLNLKVGKLNTIDGVPNYPRSSRDLEVVSVIIPKGRLRIEAVSMSRSFGVMYTYMISTNSRDWYLASPVIDEDSYKVIDNLTYEVQ